MIQTVAYVLNSLSIFYMVIVQYLSRLLMCRVLIIIFIFAFRIKLKR